MTLSGQTVLIVGAASGLGAACVQAFAGRGAQCIAVDRNAAALAQLGGEVGRVEAVAGDATDPAFAQSFAGRPIDILIHTAGIDPLSAVDVPGTSLEDWSAVLAVNLTSAFLFTRAVLPGMIERQKGCLLFTGSVSGLRPTPMEAAYSVSKAGVIQLARAIALDHARQGVRANVLCPGLRESVMARPQGSHGPRRDFNAARSGPIGCLPWARGPLCRNGPPCPDPVR